MRISDVEKQTGLTRKTIRFYEAKGLLTVGRSDNSYRDYDEAVVAELRRIVILRKAGISLSDVQLWQSEVITWPEMIHKRLHELRDAADEASEQTDLCRALLDRGLDHAVSHHFDEPFTETIPTAEPDKPSDLCAGIDIGTTTISAVVLSKESLRAEATYTFNANASLAGDEPWEKAQDARLILARVRRLLDFLLERFPSVRSIGFSGQMHGILYLDGNGEATSPLYTWQDGRAGLGSPSVCERIEERTGYHLSPGYGIATHVYNRENGLVPEDAVMLSTVTDYVAASLCGLARPVSHASNAASLGLYRADRNDFDRDALDGLGIGVDFLPRVVDAPSVIGFYRGIPVSVPIGDNQASFLGAVRDPETSALANFGTGSQISVLLRPGEENSPELRLSPSVEVRPMGGGYSLACGSALCGGRAYAMLERFFRGYLDACGIPAGEQYEVMNRLALEGLRKPPLSVVTSFCGTREDPGALGRIGGISESGFTPDALTAGFVRGMAGELAELWHRIPHGRIRTLVVSGNAARKNPALREALGEAFGLEIVLPDSMEEAACGAAIFSARASARASAQIPDSVEPSDQSEQHP